jgi:hypothetical protein
LLAGDVGGLLAGLHHAAHDHVLDLGGIDLGAVDEGVQHLACEVGRMPAGEAASLAASGGACCGDDIGLGHGLTPCVSLSRWPAIKRPLRI